MNKANITFEQKISPKYHLLSIKVLKRTI